MYNKVEILNYIVKNLEKNKEISLYISIIIQVRV